MGPRKIFSGLGWGLRGSPGVLKGVRGSSGTPGPLELSALGLTFPLCIHVWMCQPGCFAPTGRFHVNTLLPRFRIARYPITIPPLCRYVATMFTNSFVGQVCCSKRGQLSKAAFPWTLLHTSQPECVPRSWYNMH